MKLGKWLGLAVAAVILAEGLWAILVSLTRSLLLPLLARLLAVDPHSPLYLGAGDINVPDLFAAIVQLCLAGILFLIIKSWAGKPDAIKIAPVKKPVAPTSLTTTTTAAPTTPPVPVASKPATSPAVEAQPTPVPLPPRPAPVAPAAAPAPPPPPAAQAPAVPKKSAEKPPTPPKPKKPQEVYYNSVGEPLNPTEE